MSDVAVSGLEAGQTENEFLSEVLHGLSQPLTALECGLEMSLHNDKTVASLRARMATLLATAQSLHQRLLELRALQDACDAGDVASPIAMDVVLSQLEEDFAPVARVAGVRLTVKCAPALVMGNAERLRNGFFQLLELLLRQCRGGGSVHLIGHSAAAQLEIGFRVRRPGDCAASAELPEVDRTDLALRIARRTFEAAGGALQIGRSRSGGIAGRVRLPMAG